MDICFLLEKCKNVGSFACYNNQNLIKHLITRHLIDAVWLYHLALPRSEHVCLLQAQVWFFTYKKILLFFKSSNLPFHLKIIQTLNTKILKVLHFVLLRATIQDFCLKKYITYKTLSFKELVWQTPRIWLKHYGKGHFSTLFGLYP